MVSDDGTAADIIPQWWRSNNFDPSGVDPEEREEGSTFNISLILTAHSEQFRQCSEKSHESQESISLRFPTRVVITAADTQHSDVILTNSDHLTKGLLINHSHFRLYKASNILKWKKW